MLSYTSLEVYTNFGILPRNYFSWERFFTALLIEETKGTYLAYFKRNLNPVYLNESIKTAILSQMKKIKIDRKK